MATLKTMLTSHNRSNPSSDLRFRSMDDSFLSQANRNFFMTQMNIVPKRPTHYLDDTDVLALRRQYENLDLLEHSRLSNSAEDISQLDKIPYPFDIYDPENDEIEEDDMPFDDGIPYEYDQVIGERVKKANAQFEHDETSKEFKPPQRVSFGSLVKAVDIIQDPEEHDVPDLFNQSSMSTVTEEISARTTIDSNNHEYTVPLNDTQPKQGPSLLQQLKALQFNGAPRADDSSINGVAQANQQPTASMVVVKNGRFDLQNTDDYLAKDSIFLPKPPSEPKQTQVSGRRPLAAVRPKSSDSAKRATSATTVSPTKNKTESNSRTRPKSAGLPSSSAVTIDKPSSGVDFNELLRKAAEKRRSELREERRKKEEAEEKRRIEFARAKESYDRWVAEKNSERRRINQEKEMEKTELQVKQANDEKRLTELRRQKYRQWIGRKNHEAMIADEFKRLKANDEELASEGSSTSSHNENRRAFHRWLRRKYQQTLQEKRRTRSETTKRQRRSLKRHQLHHDLQLARSFGYS